MRSAVLLACIGLTATTPALGQARRAGPALRVSAQGILHGEPYRRSSPLGTLSLEIAPLEGDFQLLLADLRVRSLDGSSRVLPRVRGNGFLVSDPSLIVVVEATHSNAVPARLAVLDLAGRTRWERAVPALTDPTLSSDGRHLAWRSRRGVSVLDLHTFALTRHPDLARFAVGPGGALAGLRPGADDGLVLRDDRGAERVIAMPAPVRRLAFQGERALLLLTGRALLALDADGAGLRTLFTAPADDELRDLAVRSDGVWLGVRHRAGGQVGGQLVRLAPGGGWLGATNGPVIVPPAAPIAPTVVGSIPWPLAPNGQHPVGNTYGEFQDYGGSPYLHPGVDVLGADSQPVFAVAGGEVKAVLTTSGQWHWRVAIADVGGAGTSEGYLYAHLDQPTITVSVGDVVKAGDYLGDLVPWPVAGFTHCHFARIEDSGAQWSGSWLCPENPHPHLQNQSESAAPVFEPAIGADLFAFCDDETSNYRDPADLSGRVDVVVHVGDAIASGWVCAVQELRYSIWPAGQPDAPVVDDKLAVRFDMALDTYQGGPIDPFLVDLLYKQDGVCDTDGDYGSREFFHVITNSDGDDVYEAADQWEAWDTGLVPDGDYVIEVTAIDAAGNESKASMTVTTDNGKP